MNLVTDRQHLIQKVSQEIDALGLKSSEPAIRIQVEKLRPVNRPRDLAALIEHTLLKPEATREDIIALCNEAKQLEFRGVCVNPVFVEEAKQQLVGTDCLVVSVVGFPFGASLTASKVEEVKQVIKLGADEVDMVIALGALKGRDYKAVYQDIKAVVAVAGSIPVKVILETVLLGESEKIAACLLAMRAGAAFVKTSTGFAFIKTPNGFAAGGATIDDVTLMRAIVGDRLGIKAAGGIRSFKAAREMVEAGATRLGCSASVAIVTESLQSERHRN